jgi:hypothetical protein
MKQLVSSVALALAVLAAPAASAATHNFRAVLSGPAESPPVASPGYGIATIVIDDVAKTFSLSLPFQDLLSDTFAAHLHCCTTDALMGTAGVALPFNDFPMDVRSGTYTQTFNLADATSYQAAYLSANGGTADSAFTALLDGIMNNQSYLNIHTDTYPGGEIRGFLVSAPIPEPESWAMLLAGLAGVGLMARRRQSAREDIAQV